MTSHVVTSPLTLDTSFQSLAPPANLSSLKKGSFSGVGSGSMGVVSPPRRRSTTSISPNAEIVLNEMELEAISAVHDLRSVVKDIYVSDKLPRTSDLIYLNLTTIEGQPFCVELTSMKGWRVTSLRHDCMNGDIAHLDLHIKYFDTMHSLMQHVSPEYADKVKDATLNGTAPEIDLQCHVDSELAHICSELQTFT